MELLRNKRKIDRCAARSWDPGAGLPGLVPGHNDRGRAPRVLPGVSGRVGVTVSGPGVSMPTRSSVPLLRREHYLGNLDWGTGVFDKKKPR